MPTYVVRYVRAVDYVSNRFGRLAMYAIFLMIGVLLLDAFTRNILNIPMFWCIEMAQFTMTGYYIVGGAYSMQLNSHVRMDLLYARWSTRTKARVDTFTSFFLVFYLVCLLIGSISSTMYAIEYGERKFSMWNPSMVPIKCIMVFGIFLMLLQSVSMFFKDLATARGVELKMSYEAIAILMFVSMLLMLLTGQRVFAAIGFVSAATALMLWGDGAVEMPFNAAFKLFNWYPMLTLPLFIYMGYILSESGIADDLYRMFHVWFGGLRGGLAVGTIGLMVVISAMNGLSVAGMAIGATIALPEMLRRGYDKVMITGVVQAGSSLGILVPPSVVLVLYGMIARQPVSQLWLAGVIPGLMMAAMFIIYIIIRCRVQPHLGPTVSAEERNMPMRDKLKLLRAGTTPFLIFFFMTGLFVMGITSLVESSAVGATTATIAAAVRGRLSWKVMEDTMRKTLGISCMFMWIILAALCFGSVFDGIGAVKAIESLFVTRWDLSPWEVLIMMQLSYLLMGMFLDDTAMLVIVAPLYVPLVVALGFDPIWYGVLYTITCQIAYMTPPFGYNLFLMRAMAPPEITLSDIYRSITPFVMVMVLALVLVMVFPQIAMWLPSQFR